VIICSDPDRGSRQLEARVMKAWWTYWASLDVALILWIGAIVALGRDGFRSALAEPIPATILAAPIAIGGLNLILFRASHQTVCRLEAERHGWLRMLVGRGYSSTTFAVTGVALLALAAYVVVAALAG
jgi:hypothetical protein